MTINIFLCILHQAIVLAYYIYYSIKYDMGTIIIIILILQMRKNEIHRD